MHFTVRETVFWLRFARWMRGASAVAQWPTYRELLHDQCVWLMVHSTRPTPALVKAHDALAAAKSAEDSEPAHVQGTLF